MDIKNFQVAAFVSVTVPLLMRAIDYATDSIYGRLLFTFFIWLIVMIIAFIIKK